MTLNEMREIVSRIEYRPGWSFYVSKMDFSWGNSVYFLHLTFMRPDRDTGVESLGTANPVVITENITEVSLVQACLGTILSVEEHEARERFHYWGDRVFDPHRKSF